MTSKACSRLLALALVLAAGAPAQFRGFQAASIVPPAPLELRAGEEVELPLTVRIRRGYHINSDNPAEEYLIPTRVTWNAAPLEVMSVEYPEAEIVIYEFSDEPLLVYSGDIVIRTRFKVPSKPPSGLSEIAGSLRYQACNDKACLAPATAEFKAPVIWR